MKVFFIMLFASCVFLSRGQDSLAEIRFYSNTFQLLSRQINLGVEKTVDRTIYGIDVSYYMYDAQMFGNSVEFHLKKLLPNSECYIGLGMKGALINFNPEATFVYDEFEKSGELFEANVSKSEVLQEYDIEKKSGELNVKIGNRVLTNSLFIDVYLGVGVRYKDVTHKYPVPFEEVYKHKIYRDIRDREGKYVLPVLKLGMLIGFRVKYPKKHN